MLTQQILKENLSYDELTGDFTRLKANSNSVSIGEIAGWIDKTTGYRKINIGEKTVYAHRLAWLYLYGSMPPHEIDHINGVRSDNRKCNLRSATHAKNLKNQAIRNTNTSGFKGVTWYKSTNKWKAQLMIDAVNKHLGYFLDIDDAVFARKNAEIFYFGDYVRTESANNRQIDRTHR